MFVEKVEKIFFETKKISKKIDEKVNEKWNFQIFEKFSGKIEKLSTLFLINVFFRWKIFRSKIFRYVFRSQIFQRFQKSYLENRAVNPTGGARARVPKCTLTNIFLERPSYRNASTTDSQSGRNRIAAPTTLLPRPVIQFNKRFCLFCLKTTPF